MGTKTAAGSNGNAAARTECRWELASGQVEAIIVSNGGGAAPGKLRATVCEAAARISWLQVLVAAAGAVFTTELIHPVAYQRLTLRATAETLLTLLGLAAAWLLQAHARRTRSRRDLLLLGAVLTMALLELTSIAVPVVLSVHSGGEFAASVRLANPFVAAMMLAAALTLPAGPVVQGDRPFAGIAGLSLGALLVAQLGALLLRRELVAPANHPVFGIHHALHHPLAVVLLSASAALLVAASRVFARQAHVDRDGSFSLLAGACVLLAFTSLYELALPWTSPHWIASREGMRLVAFGLIYSFALRRELQARSRVVRAVAIAERRRLAQDLHDGLAQDLAFIAANSGQIAERLGGEHPIAVAARRALMVSRGAISELSSCSGLSAEAALDAVAQELGDRFQIVIDVDACLGLEPSAETREQIARIAREAITNAARHGSAEHVTISLQRAGEGMILRVSDDGRGIERADGSPPPEGFGIRSMRERAAVLGGYLTVRRGSTGGTDLEVMFP